MSLWGGDGTRRVTAHAYAERVSSRVTLQTLECFGLLRSFRIANGPVITPEALGLKD